MGQLGWLGTAAIGESFQSGVAIWSGLALPLPPHPPDWPPHPRLR